MSEVAASSPPSPFEAYLDIAVYPPCQTCLAYGVVSPHHPPHQAGKPCGTCGTPLLPPRLVRHIRDIRHGDGTEGVTFHG